MAGIDGFATTIARETVTPGVYTVIGSVTALKPPALKRNTIDVTAHDSAGEWMEFIGGLKDAGEVSFDINYNPAVHDTIAITDFAVSTTKNWKITFPDATTWIYAAVLTGFAPNAPYDDKLSATLTFKVTGSVTMSA